MRRDLLRRNASLLDIVSRVVDPLIIAATGYIAWIYYLRFPELDARYALAMVSVSVVGFLVFPALGLYQSQRGASFTSELRSLALGWLILGLFGALFLFLTKEGARFSRGWAILWLVGGFTAHVLFRALLRVVLRNLRRRGLNLRHIVVVGAGQHAREVARRLRASSWSGMVITAFYESEPTLIGTSIDGIPVSGPLDRLAQDLSVAPVDQVWIALPLSAEATIRMLLEDLRQTPVQVCFVPDIYGFHLLHHSFTEVAGMPVVNLTSSPHAGVNSTLKLLEDFTLALLLLLVTAPLWIIIAIAIKLTSPGPILYRQQRITWNGRAFTMYKFRTMPIDSESDTGPVWSRHGEQRATAVGRLLRRVSLDELPQLINVLRNDMSLVGPRPERPEFVQRFRHEIPGYMQKHLVKAGITGWAQVNDLRGDSDLARRIEFDLYYIENWSLWFDFRILVLTAWHIVASRNAH
ncbi:MAG TPA: undecaprenyl-phosphate glucose phosphotransferase [Casimicrobiaceae bacterium]|nr:undecaprenyl-phosphate glucose phosphotransferase [Casimicrobiaceae bacterium]